MVAYEGKEPFVFVSYAHKDKNKVLPIVEGLQNRGFRVWYDKRGISAGSEWPEAIAEHLANCHCMVAFVSRNFGDSNNCREELNFAKELDKTILVVYLEDRKNLRASVRMRLGTLHSLNLNDYAGDDAFLQEVSEEEALLPCLGECAEPIKPAEPTAEELYEQGRILYDSKDYEKAVPLFQKAAEKGHAKAQTELSVCYFRGKGVLRNSEEVAKWCRMAAEQNDADGQTKLGYCYQYGEGVAQNKEEAVKWYRKAAEQGNASAQNNLGYCYDHGEGVERDEAEAVKWYRKAAEQGEATAQGTLGHCYQYGKGVEENKEEAVKWYRKAAEQGYARAQYNLGRCYQWGDAVQKDKSEARKWYQKAADQGFDPAIKTLKTL